MALVREEIKANAEVYHGDEICQEKSKLLLTELVSYEPEITAYVEQNKIKKLTGVKTKELLLWITLSDIYVDDPPTGKITFKTPAGLFRSFPVSAFVLEDVKDVKKAMDVKKAEEEAGSGEVKEVSQLRETRSIQA
ncbi:unnamed protein product, partial [Vitis vinifera]